MLRHTGLHRMDGAANKLRPAAAAKAKRPEAGLCVNLDAVDPGVGEVGVHPVEEAQL